MKIAMIYVSKHGATKDIARKIQAELDDAELISLEENSNPLLEKYDAVVLGAPYYMGTLHGAMNAFVTKHERSLLKKPLGLFVCGMAETPEKQAAELTSAYTPALYEHAEVKAFMGGRITASQLNVGEKMVIRMVTKKPVEDTDTIDTQAIEEFIDAFKNILQKKSS